MQMVHFMSLNFLLIVAVLGCLFGKCVSATVFFFFNYQIVPFREFEIGRSGHTNGIQYIRFRSSKQNSVWAGCVFQSAKLSNLQQFCHNLIEQPFFLGWIRCSLQSLPFFIRNLTRKLDIYQNECSLFHVPHFYTVASLIPEPNSRRNQISFLLWNILFRIVNIFFSIFDH